MSVSTSICLFSGGDQARTCNRGEIAFIIWREHAEVGSFHDNNPSSVDVTLILLRDRPSSEHVVSGAHRHTDAGVFAFGYGISDTFSERVLDSSNAN